MKRECKRIQEDLIDVLYQEKPMSESIEMHLKDCPDCNAHWEALHAIKQDLSLLGGIPDVEPQGIEQAFKTAGLLRKKSRDRIDFGIFLLVITVIMFVLIGAVTMGYGMAVIIMQAAFAFIAPVVVPLLFIRKLKGGNA